MDKGKIAMTGSPMEIFSKGEELESMGLGVPQVSSVMRGLKEKGFNVPLDIYTIEEATDVIYGLLKVTK